MRKNQKLLPRLAALVTTLMLLNLFTFVLTAKAILQISDNTPVAELQIHPEPRAASAEAPEPLTVPEFTDPAPLRPVRPEANPGVEIRDDKELWRRETEVEIFHAWYDSETGGMTVNSYDGDKVIAPGTGSQYYFDIINTGPTGARYWLEATSGSATVEYNGRTVEIPVEVRFRKYRGETLVDAWSPLTDLNGVKDRGALSASHYARYILQWQWPFEGDDTLDTYLGNLAADGAELRVWIRFTVTAEADDLAEGGNPRTGDPANLALWTGLFVCSGFALVILLFGRRKEDADAWM